MVGDRTSSKVRYFPECDSGKGSVQEAPEAPTSGLPFVTYSELLQLAQRRHCHGIHTEPVRGLCRPEKNFWVFKATVYKSAQCRGFVGYGDAHPGNVPPLIVNHAEMRMAETRAVNRALRKAYGIALCSVEELPPWGLSPQQIPELRRTLQSRSLLQKGVRHAHPNPRSKSAQPEQASRGGPLSRARGSVRTRRARR